MINHGKSARRTSITPPYTVHSVSSQFHPKQPLNESDSRTNRGSTKVLKVDEVEAHVVFGPQHGPRVFACRNPDRDEAQAEDEVGRDDDEPQKVKQIAVPDDAH